MNDSWNIIGWAIIALIILLVLVVFLTYGRVVTAQWRADYKRKRAHAGKVACEDEKDGCLNTATRVTPNGYYCDVHWLENSRKASMTGSWSWAHKLNHTMTPEEK